MKTNYHYIVGMKAVPVSGESFHPGTHCCGKVCSRVAHDNAVEADCIVEVAEAQLKKFCRQN
jgi:hypothetical protein